MADAGFHAFVRELLAGMGPLTIKRFFGGGGVYADGVMFAMIADDTLHLKVDDALKRDLEAQGSGPFLWTPATGPKAGQTLALGYWRLPEATLDDPDEAVRWARRALDVARAKAAAKPKTRKKPSK